jgi:thioredoxin-like negative regulator of GroEL
VSRLRPQYQDRINFVILDYDLPADKALSKSLGVHAHPAFAVIDANGSRVVERFFGPQQEQQLRERIDAALAVPSS